ncbi:hypothetical protein IEO70_02125 [Bacillus sp. AGMB 02131]|uniref:B3/B4 tRNA-binding domain-containing protein n=1 Tax=Peribacillus faecalis TaxID=2772559 RepID=A0A927H934_9BACI|nr:phenylalanine--tRNA ligase beta subunit-related protein [Peribacillus faecalis]MBD3107165.1 hypothetical protein [Peribacillus faecalis]
MNISINSSIKSKIPSFKIGCIIYKDITVGDSPQMLRGRLQFFQELLFMDINEKELSDFPGIKEWRTVFKLAGTDPSRYRHSAESLYRRIKKQNYLSTVNSAIDLNNFFSLQYQSPFGIYDLNQIDGDITFTIGTEEDTYFGLNERNNTMKDIIISQDRQGPFGSPYIDSNRTMVTSSTNRAIQFIYLRPSLSFNESEKLTSSVMNSFISIHGGEAHFKIYQ